MKQKTNYIFYQTRKYGEKQVWIQFIATRQLDFYRIKGVTENNVSAAIKEYNSKSEGWWLRSAVSVYTLYFLSVHQTGAISSWDANENRGISPAFRIA